TVLPCSAAANSDANNPKQSSRPRYTPPSTGQARGWIDLDQYNFMPNPVEAGHLLLSEAKLVGLDVDDSTNVFAEPKPVRFPNGQTASPEEAFAFLRGVRVTQDKSRKSNAPASFLVSLRRWPTLKERANAMLAGIRFSREVPEQAIMMAM